MYLLFMKSSLNIEYLDFLNIFLLNLFWVEVKGDAVIFRAFFIGAKANVDSYFAGVY